MLKRAASDLHILLIAGSGILLVSRDIDLSSLGNGYIFVSLGVTGADLRPFLRPGQMGKV